MFTLIQEYLRSKDFSEDDESDGEGQRQELLMLKSRVHQTIDQRKLKQRSVKQTQPTFKSLRYVKMMERTNELAKPKTVVKLKRAQRQHIIKIRKRK